MKLKYSEVKTQRLQKLLEQDNRCSLCGETIEDDAVLDHDHKTGKIRHVLHRGCNALLGKIENNMARNKVSLLRLKGIADNIYEYLNKDYDDVLHPTYKTPEEKKLKRKKKR